MVCFLAIDLRLQLDEVLVGTMCHVLPETRYAVLVRKVDTSYSTGEYAVSGNRLEQWTRFKFLLKFLSSFGIYGYRDNSGYRVIDLHIFVVRGEVQAGYDCSIIFLYFVLDAAYRIFWISVIDSSILLWLEERNLVISDANNMTLFDVSVLIISVGLDIYPKASSSFTHVDAGMHKEDPQATSGPKSLGITGEERGHPQLSSCTDPNVLTDQTKSVTEGLETVLTEPVTRKLLAKSVHSEFSKMLSTHDFSSSLPTELKKLPTNFQDLNEELKGLTKQVHDELEIELPGHLKEFLSLLTQVESVQAKLKTLDALLSLLLKVETASGKLVTPSGALSDTVWNLCDASESAVNKEALETLAWRRRLDNVNPSSSIPNSEFLDSKKKLEVKLWLEDSKSVDPLVSLDDEIEEVEEEEEEEDDLEYFDTFPTMEELGYHK
ncbi:hypothetical protein Tco_0259645 [Tanacetum coccineum]